MDNPLVLLADWQIWVIALVASLLVMVINWLAGAQAIKIFKWTWNKKAWHIGRFWLTLLIFLPAAGLTWWWFPAVLPALPVLTGLPFGAILGALWEYAKVLIQALVPFVGTAQVIYNLALQYFYNPEKRKALWRGISASFLKLSGWKE